MFFSHMNKSFMKQTTAVDVVRKITLALAKIDK